MILSYIEMLDSDFGMAKCRDVRFIHYFLSENKYWCHHRKDYVDPESSLCDKFKAPVKDH